MQGLPHSAQFLGACVLEPGLRLAPTPTPAAGDGAAETPTTPTMPTTEAVVVEAGRSVGKGVMRSSFRHDEEVKIWMLFEHYEKGALLDCLKKHRILLPNAHAHEYSSDYFTRQSRSESLASPFATSSLSSSLSSVMSSVPWGSDDGPYVDLERQGGSSYLSYRQKLICLWHACLGVSELHAAGIIHRDIAARNFLVDKDWKVLVADLGLARQVVSTLTLDLGVRPWLWSAPETLLLSRSSFKSDVWALGVLIYEVMCDGEAPYEYYKAQERVHAVAKGRSGDGAKKATKADAANAATKLRNDITFGRINLADHIDPKFRVPAPVVSIMRHCLAVDPTSRPSAAEVAGMVSALLS